MIGIAHFEPQSLGDLPSWLLFPLVLWMYLEKYWLEALPVILIPVLLLWFRYMARRPPAPPAAPSPPSQVRRYLRWRAGPLGIHPMANASMILGALSLADLVLAFRTVLQPAHQRLLSPLAIGLPAFLLGPAALLCLAAAAAQRRISINAFLVAAVLGVGSCLLAGMLLLHQMRS